MTHSIEEMADGIEYEAMRYERTAGKISTDVGKQECLRRVAYLRAAAKALRETERLRAVVEAAGHLPRATPAPGAAGTEHSFKIPAWAVWGLDTALTALEQHRATPPLAAAVAGER